MDKSFESIIPTALYTAYPLIFTDIPYSQEVYNELNKLGFPDHLRNDKLAPELEARFKLIDKFLDRENNRQVFEIASGFTTRGINKCLKNEKLTYVELDLPQVIEKKERIFKNIATLPNNLHFNKGNALVEKEFNKCEKYFDKKNPISVVNQGFMRYLSFEEKKLLALNIHKLLSKHGGVWITPDVTPAKFLVNQDKHMKGFNEKLSEETDRNQASWRFESRDAVNNFFGNIGFDIEWHDFIEAKDLLVSPRKLGFSDEVVYNALEHAVVVIMRVKTN